MSVRGPLGLHWAGCLLVVAALVGCSRRASVRSGASGASGALGAAGQAVPVTSAAVPALVSADELRDLLRRVGFGGAGRGAPVRVLDLEAAAQRAAPAERALIERLIRLVRVLDPSGEVPSPAVLLESLQEYAGILRGVGELYPDDVPAQLMVAASLGTMPEMMSSFDLNDGAAATAFQRESTARVEALVQRFPNVADVHALRAWLCERTEGEPLSCLRYWARCFELEPKNGCAAEYARGTRNYSVPFCAGPNIRSELTFRGAHGTAVDAAPSFRGADLLSISVSTAPPIEYIGDAAREIFPPGTVVRVRLKPERAAAFETWTASLAADRSPIALMRGTKVLSSPILHNALKGSFELTGVELHELCATTERKTLPADLPAVP